LNGVFSAVPTFGKVMRRRDFITGIAGSAGAWPLAARAQQPAMPVIGLLHSQSPEEYAGLLRRFRQGLRDTGFVEGENLSIEYRWANNQLERLPALAAELIRRRVAVIVSLGSATVALAGDHDHPHRFQQRRRPDQARDRREPRSAGRQPDRRQLSCP
jgi:hypothetical protein